MIVSFFRLFYLALLTKKAMIFSNIIWSMLIPFTFEPTESIVCTFHSGEDYVRRDSRQMDGKSQRKK